MVSTVHSIPFDRSHTDGCVLLAQNGGWAAEDKQRFGTQKWPLLHPQALLRGSDPNIRPVGLRRAPSPYRYRCSLPFFRAL